MTTYIPPLPGRGPLSFIGPYTAPLPGRGPLSFGAEVSGQTLNPLGIDDGGMGAVHVTGPKTLLAQSIGDTMAMGSPGLKFGQFFIYPGGFLNTYYGRPTLQLKDRYIGAIGFNYQAFGTDWISYYLRGLTPSGIKMDAYGNATMAGGVRWAPMNGFATQAFGTQLVTLAVREVFPTWFVATFYGTPMMGYTRDIAAIGSDVAKFGVQYVWDNTLHIHPAGADTSAFGLQWADRRIRTIGAKSFVDGDLQNIGFPRLYNKRQYIVQSYVEAQWDNGGIGDYQSMFVKNVNRKVDLVGNGIAPPFRQIPLTHRADNNARVLHPPGLDATLWGRKIQSDGFFIAYRNRPVPIQGFEPVELSSRFHIVRNAAYQAKAIGWDSARLGVPPLVVNTRRYFDHFTLNKQDSYGTPFIAPRIRTIGPQNPLDPVRGIIGGATIWFRVRPLAPIPDGYPSWGAFGKAAVDSRRNDVFAKSIPPSWQWGYGAVRNNTPEITPYWDTSLFTLFGQQAIFNRYNPYNIEGFPSLVFGPNTIVTYRTKRPIPTGFDALRFNPKHTIRNLNPDPPGQQYVIEAGLGALGGVGMPSTSVFNLLPAGIFALTFGTPKIQGMSIFPVGIPAFIGDNGTQFGTPAVPGQQWANVSAIYDEQWGKPHFDPYTIWAPQGAPDQAIRNHGSAGEQIDAFLDRNNLIRPLFGRPRVELKNRIIYQTNPYGSTVTFGQPRLSRRPQTITPDGIRFTKYGFPELFGGDRSVDAAGFDLTQYGQASMAIIEPFDRALFLTGLSTNLTGSAWVSNFIRNLPPAGLDATRWGTTWVQRPPPPAYPPGLDDTRWGSAMVAYRIRHLPIEGMDTFVCDYTLASFRDRMRVHSRNYFRNTTLGMQSSVGVPSFDAKIRNLYPASIDPLPDHVTRPSTRRQNRVNMVSLGLLTGWGEPWALATTHGTIQPRGEDFAQIGQPRGSYQVFLDGWMGQLGQARTGIPIGAQGADTSQFGQTVAMGFGCGLQARAIRGWDSGNVGTASVTRGA